MEFRAIAEGPTGAVVEKRHRHPTTAHMVSDAISSLRDRKGSSLKAINRYIASIYGIDISTYSVYIKTYIRNALATGKLIQSKGDGLNGSFKLPKIEKAKRVKQIKDKDTEQKSTNKPKKKVIKIAMIAKDNESEPTSTTQDVVVKSKPKSKLAMNATEQKAPRKSVEKMLAHMKKAKRNAKKIVL